MNLFEINCIRWRRETSSAATYALSIGKRCVPRPYIANSSAREAAPFLGLAVDLVRRFLPNADQTTLIMAAVWLVGQCSIFVRNREQLANPPVSLALNEAAIERLTILVSGWALAGLAQAG